MANRTTPSLLSTIILRLTRPLHTTILIPPSLEPIFLTARDHNPNSHYNNLTIRMVPITSLSTGCSIFTLTSRHLPCLRLLAIHCPLLPPPYLTLLPLTSSLAFRPHTPTPPLIFLHPRSALQRPRYLTPLPSATMSPPTTIRQSSLHRLRHTRPLCRT